MVLDMELGAGRSEAGHSLTVPQYPGNAQDYKIVTLFDRFTPNGNIFFSIFIYNRLTDTSMQCCRNISCNTLPVEATAALLSPSETMQLGSLVAKGS
jgi:hypothetical protein